MPASHRIDLRAGVVFSVIAGHVTNEELLELQRRISVDPDFRPTMHHIIDTRGVTDVSVTALGVRLITTRNSFGPGSRRAIIEGETIPSYGYLRMFQTLRNESGEDTRVFSSVEDARRWLGLDCPGAG
jgi:hypothetical protein